MELATKIQTNGIMPTKAEVYTLAAELVETEGITGFRDAVIEAMKSYDYDYYDYYYCDYDYYYCDYTDYDYDYDCDYTDYSVSEKVIALLLLAAMYS